MKYSAPFKFLTLLTVAAWSQSALASGYHFGTQSVSQQSTANAAAAEASDATTLFSNPAGLTELQSKAEITGALNIVVPSVRYNHAKATYFRGGDVSGETSGEVTQTTAAPHVYGAYKLNDCASVGMGMYIPFGSKTDFGSQSALRYNLDKLGLTTVALEPALAFKLNEKHSFGVGLVAQYTQAELTKFADWSASQTDTQLRQTAAVLQRTGVPASVTSNRANWQARGDVKGHDWGFGYHLGWMFDAGERLRVGVSYRSKVEHTLRGTAHWKPVGAMVRSPALATIQLPMSAGGRGYLPSEDASVKIVTPESLSVHGMYRATDRLNLFGDVTWTRHSRFNKANLVFENTKNVVQGQSNSTTIVPNWRDTYRVSVGASYQYSEPLQLRAGFAWDQSPVKSSEDRQNTLPDGNRLWFSAGARYTYKQRHVFDAAVSYIRINHNDFTNTAASGRDIDSKGASSANFNSHATVLGLQYTYKF